MEIEDRLRYDNPQEVQETGEVKETSEEARHKVEFLVTDMMLRMTKTQIKEFEKRIRLIIPQEL